MSAHVRAINYSSTWTGTHAPVSTGPCALTVTSPNSRWSDGAEKGALGDDLSSFHRDIWYLGWQNQKIKH